MYATENTTETGPYDGGVVTTRGSYRIGPFNLVYPTLGTGTNDYQTESVPGIDDENTPDEIAVFIHGWLLDRGEADTTFNILRDTLKYNGYSHPLIGVTWDSDLSIAVDDWYPSVYIAKANGSHIARFLNDYRQENPETTIRLMGHSLGCLTVFETLRQLSRENWEQGIDSVTLLGAAIDDDAPQIGMFGYGRSIGAIAEKCDNFYTINDNRLKYYPFFQADKALGRYGSAGNVPNNYTDHHFPSIDSHLHYYRKEVGCIDSVIQGW